MATRHGGLSFKMVDALGVSTSMFVPMRVDDTKTVAQMLTDVDLIGQQIDPITDSQITHQTASVVLGGPTAGKSSPASTAENERTGLFNLSQSTGPYKFGIDVPGIADSKLSGGKINLSDADILAFITALTVAGTALTPESTSLYTLVALLDALITFRKHRKAESRRSLAIP